MSATFSDLPLSSPIFHPVGQSLGEAFWSRWRKGNANNQYVLHHYTGSVGLAGIVQSRSLRLCHIDYLNDATEGREATGILLEAAIEFVESTEDAHSKEFGGQLVSMLGGARRSDVLDTFIGCFSTERDDLSQWRAYSGGEGGYCIAFRAESLWRQKTGQGRKSGYWMLPCMYEREAVKALAISCLAQGAELSRPLASSFGMVRLLEVFMVTVAWYGAAIKHHAFASEREWRYIYYRIAEVKEDIGFAIGSTFKPYVSFDFGSKESMRDAIHEVMVGPHRHPELAARSVRAFLASELGGDVPVSSSVIPFRLLV